MYYGYGGYGGYYGTSYMIQWILIIIPFVLCLFAQFLVNSRYKKYSRIGNSRGITGAQAAQMLLRSRGVNDVRIEQIAGKLSDNYDPRSKVIHLSQDVFNGTSIAAVGIACHEAGHACQHNENYFPIKIRNLVIPVANIGSTIGFPLCLIGLIFSYVGSIFTTIAYVGLILYGAVFVFQLVTLPVEFNASARALATIKETNILSSGEYVGAKKVLSAAALTYVAAMASSLLTLFRLFLLINNRRR